MKKILFSLVVLSLLIGAFGVLAQDDNLPSPGITPDSSFYFLKAWKEKIQLFFTFGAENKAKQFLHLCEVRLAEYEKMIEKGKTEIAKKTFEKYERQLDSALEKVDEARMKGKSVGALAEEIQEKRIKHAEILGKVAEKMSEEIKGEIIQDRSPKWMDFISAVKDRYPQAISAPPENAANLPVSLMLNCPIPELPEAGACPGEWLFQSGGNCPYFACSEDGKKPVSEPPELPIIEPPGSEVCIQVITPAMGPDGTCQEFPTPCDVPEGWNQVDQCPEKPTAGEEPTEIRYYTCPDGTKVESGKCYAGGRCAIQMSPERQCPQQTTPVTRGTECPTQGETKYYQCADGTEIPWCLCLLEGSFAGAKNKWQCQYYSIGFTCSEQIVSPVPVPTVEPQKYPEGKCTSGEVINYKCSDGTSFKWCTCDDLGWDCGYIYKYAERLCPATEEITLDTEAGQQMPATCALGEAINQKCSDGTIIRACICEELGDTGTTAWECGMVGVCPKSGSPAVSSVSISGAVTSDLPVELETTPFGTVRITWFVSEPVTSRLEYGLTTSYGSTAGTDYFDATYQGAELSDLQSDITYHFRIRVRDKDTTPNTVVTEDYTFILRKLPDLAVFPISVDHFNADMPNKIHVNIENNGVATASKGFVVKVYVDDNLVGESTYASDLAAGASGEKIFDYTFPGNKSYATIKAVVDATNLVTELNEKNNEMRHDISIYGSVPE